MHRPHDSLLLHTSLCADFRNSETCFADLCGDTHAQFYFKLVHVQDLVLLLLKLSYNPIIEKPSTHLDRHSLSKLNN